MAEKAYKFISHVLLDPHADDLLQQNYTKKGGTGEHRYARKNNDFIGEQPGGTHTSKYCINL